MGKVVANAIMSLDGYVAKQDNTIGRLFDWLQNGETALPTPAGDFTVHLTPASAEHWRRWVSSLVLQPEFVIIVLGCVGGSGRRGRRLGVGVAISTSAGCAWPAAGGWAAAG